jgi:cellulose synthase/poly-beta-1,6-N-acetylglucosamine synthase-like glycosyltransferase
MDYPKDRLEIQVLDDSTDDTVMLTKDKVDYYATQGFDIRLIHRTSRSGFKAGALQAGLLEAKGDLLAIFDADFLPRADFLKNTVLHFEDDTVGAIQTRWEHLNEDFSFLTRMQAFQLNVHFTIEQTGRLAADLPLQFNGTAGIWRKSAIESSGGWQSDTLTEDLDLSYRAQLNGWKILYLERVGAPAELPAEMMGLKSQQFRWTKGGAETARKILPVLWRSRIPFLKKIFASQHLLASVLFVCILLSGVFSVPIIFIARQQHFDIHYFSYLLLGFVAVNVVFFVANARTSWSGFSTLRKLRNFTIQLPMYISLSMGLSLHNSIAVWEGLVGKCTSFIRTPKFALGRQETRWNPPRQMTQGIPLSAIFEGILALYFLAAIAAAIILQEYAFLFFHVLMMFGFATIFFYTLKHRNVSYP